MDDSTIVFEIDSCIHGIIGCWNVRTMSGREEELIDEMKRYGLEVLGVSEAGLKGME